MTLLANLFAISIVLNVFLILQYLKAKEQADLHFRKWKETVNPTRAKRHR
jgi:hypothetical protein